MWGSEGVREMRGKGAQEQRGRRRITIPNAQFPIPYFGVLFNEGAGDAAGLGMREAVAAFLISSLY